MVSGKSSRGLVRRAVDKKGGGREGGLCLFYFETILEVILLNHISIIRITSIALLIDDLSICT